MKKSKILSFILVFFLVLFLLSNQIFAKYNYLVVLDAFSLKRDNSEITYQIEKSIPDGQYTNQDVTLKILLNKEVESVEGFDIDESRKMLTKILSQNESRTIELEDLSGNKKEINYAITNIDKEVPQIIGIEDGSTYNKKVTPQYTDNIGIDTISVEKYHNNLAIRCIEDYYDSHYYKGIDSLANQIYIDVVNHPKGTKYYNFYINNVLKATTTKSEYTFKSLKANTEYKIKVEALDINKKILKSTSKTIKTKMFTGIVTEKNGDNFKVKVKGIDNRISKVYAYLWHKDSDRIITYPEISSDRSLSYSFNAYGINGSKSTGYYYLHFQLYDSNLNLYETVCINVVFDKNYVKYNDDAEIDPYNLDGNGIYEIVVTDLAGNKTTKKCTIKI